MKRVKMKEDYQGAKAGDVVGFEDNAEADALVAAGKAEDLVALRHADTGEIRLVTQAEAEELKAAPAP